jgi:hypothetical protein
MFVNKWSLYNKDEMSEENYSQSAPKSVDVADSYFFEKSPFQLDLEQAEQAKQAEDNWDAMSACEFERLAELLDDPDYHNSILKDVQVSSPAPSLPSSLAPSLKKTSPPPQRASRQSKKRELIYNEYSEEEEEEDGGWLPPDPKFFETLTQAQHNECYESLKKNGEHYGRDFLLQKYGENRSNGVVASLAKTVLEECKYEETADCFQCHRRINVVYLKNRERCLYHVLCRECFIFTQTMLMYTWGDRPIECPQQKMHQRCRLERKKLKEDRYTTKRDTKENTKGETKENNKKIKVL